jgi:putative flippase GtrA
MKLLKQIARFMVVGGFSTLVDFVIYMLLSVHLAITTSKAISMIFASVISYILSKNWTFKNNNETNSTHIVKFYVTFFINFITNISANNIILDISGLKIFSFVMATLSAMTVNFLLQRYWVFRK